MVIDHHCSLSMRPRPHALKSLASSVGSRPRVNVVLLVSLSLIAMTVNGGCGGRGNMSGAADREAAEVPQISGTLAVSGVSAPVQVIRDRWGVPHVKAENPDDLFFAQGFVQAQDRLFQM